MKKARRSAPAHVERYALYLEGAPLIRTAATREALASPAVREARAQIEARQAAVRKELDNRRVAITGSVDTVANAIFVAAPSSQLEELKAIPGVAGVVRMRAHRMAMNTAAGLINVPAAIAAIGGNGGAGVKIAIMDSGIDNTHPSFQDSSLKAPTGFPKCDALNAARCSSYTNSKVIVARSYVQMAGAGTDPSNPAADSRPDDFSPRDHSGHGTALASISAGVPVQAAVAFSGVAPKAYLGNYRLFGSSMLNDTYYDDQFLAALNDAVADGMDVITVSSGAYAFTGALDSGAACGNSAGVPCDPSAAALNDVAAKGITVVVSAGNEADTGILASRAFSAGSVPPATYNTITTPATAPSVIATGASSNSHYFTPTVSIDDAAAPSSVKNLVANETDYPGYGGLTAPLVNAASLGDSLACKSLGSNTAYGAILLIQRGTCTFSVKAAAASNAGARGVILYMADASTLISPSGFYDYNLPSVIVSNADGLALANYLSSNPGAMAIIDPTSREQTFTANQLVFFSSRGPTYDGSMKPDVVAPGGGSEFGEQGIFMATQNLNPLGDVYSSTRYTAANGTSFSSPMTAGVAALLKQAHPTFSGPDIKSLIVNNASQDVTTDDYKNALDTRDVGAGKVDALAAVRAPVVVAPASAAFGTLIAGSLPKSQAFQVKNTGTSSVTLTAAVASAKAATGVTLALDKTSLTIAGGATATLTASLNGSLPTAGVYYGAITLQGTGVSLRIPYQYVVGDGVAYDMIGEGGGYYTSGALVPGAMVIRVTDRYGVPVSGATVTWTPLSRNASVKNASATTDAFGWAAADAQLGTGVAEFDYRVTAGALSTSFAFYTDLPANVTAVTNAAAADTGSAVAPGSYVTIWGSNLLAGYNYTDLNWYPALQMAMDYVTVSFDVPSAGISVPGRMVYISPSQINIQVPWELQGQKSALMKVTNDYTPGNVITVQLNDYAPAFFEGTAGAVAALDASYKAINATNPAKRGQMVMLYANGLGPVSNQQESGAPAPSASLALTKGTPKVTIGGVDAPVAFSGLAPGFAGLYQLNVTVPATAGTGNQPLIVTIGGVASKASGIVVQ